tara:strand:- start:20819 stop:21676 length:858 start_codon:yes stop_codon:yes gene_type:complete
MIYSMTGFGKSESSFKNKTISTEIRTLNSKNLDINLKTSFVYKELESSFRKETTKILKRGKIDIIINETSIKDESALKINKEVVKDYINQLKDVSSKNEVSLLSIAMKLPNTTSVENHDINNDEKDKILSLFIETLEKVNDFRAQEGKTMFNDFNDRLIAIENCLKKIIKVDQGRIISLKKRLKKTLNDLKINIDENRYEQELVYYIEKYDINEEKVRLNSHIKYFKDTLNLKESNGKKLGFISQEMGREINTIGSKANDFELQKIVVEMKDELEKIKEQLLNVL